MVVIIALASGGYFWHAKMVSRTEEELKESRALVFKGLKEKQELDAKLTEAKKQIQQLKAELEKTLKELDSVNAKLRVAGQENVLLQQEKQRLESRLRSLTELRKAIRQLKIEINQQYMEQLLLRKKRQKEIDAAESASGNRGYLFREGRSTHKPRVVIEVNPAE